MPTTIITDRELGRGLDGFHPETKLTEGFVVQATNWLPTYAGTLQRRTGYVRVGGYPPIRVESATRSGTTITLQLSSSLSTAGMTPSPIVLWARLVQYSTANTNFGGIGPSPVALYFPTYTVVSATQISVTGGPITNTGYTATVLPGLDTPGSYSATGLDAYIWGIPSHWTVADVDAQRTTWATGVFPYSYLDYSTPVATVNREAHVLGEAAGTSYPSVEVDANATVNGAQTIGRPIYGAIPATPPSRGYVVSPGVGSQGTLAVTSATYDPVSTNTFYTLAAPGLLLSGSVASIIRPGIDLLNVTQTAYAQYLNGEFPIVGVTSTATTIVVECSNAVNAAPDARVSDVGGAGRAGVFTDSISVGNGARIFPGDVVCPVGLASEPPDWVVAAAGPTSIVVDDLQSSAQWLLTNGELIQATRTAASYPVTDVTGFVRGDCVSVVGYTSQFVVQSITPDGDQTATVTGDGFVGSVSGLASTAELRVGDVLTLWNAGPFTGDVVIESISSGTEIQFLTSATGSAAGTVVGAVLHLDSAAQYSDATGVAVPVRWVPLDAPDVPRDVIDPALTRQYAFPQGGVADAVFPSAAQVSGSLYMTNQFDSVQKFDGSECYRSGLPNWNPLIGFDLHSNSASLITNPAGLGTAGKTSAGGSTFTTTEASDASQFNSGDVVVVVKNNGGGELIQWPTSVSGTPDPTTGIIPISPAIPSEANIEDTDSLTLYPAIQLRYYFRWVAVDGNGTTVGSYAAQSQDTLVTFGAPCVVTMKLALMALNGSRPYDRVNLQIYRTGVNGASPPVADGAPPFYLLATIPLKYAFDGATPTGAPPTAVSRYFELYEDSNQINLGSTGNTDPLLAAEPTPNSKAGSYWDEPPRALVSSTWNSELILANIRSWPFIDLAIRESPTQVPSNFTAQAAHLTRCIFRRDGAEGETTDVANVQAYQFLDVAQLTSPQVTPPGTLISSLNPGLITFSIPVASYPAVVGGWIFVGTEVPSGSTTQALNGLDFDGWFQVYAVGSSAYGAGYTDVTAVWPEKARSSVTTTATQVNTGTNTITVDGGIPTEYAVGTPIFLSVSSAGLNVSTPYWAIPVTATSFQVATSLPAALAGTPTSLTATGPAFSITTGYIPFFLNTIVIQAFNPYDIPIPLLETDPTSEQSTRFTGVAYSPQWIVEQTSSNLLQNAVDFLSQAVNSIHAGNYVNPVNGSPSRDGWLMANSGSDYAFATSRIRTPSDYSQFTVEWEGTTDASGREKFLVYVGDGRVPNFAFQPSQVTVGSPWVLWVAHGLSEAQTVRVSPSTGGALPSPLVAGTVYYALVNGANQFGLSVTPGGSPIVLTSTGSGFHALRSEVSASELRFPSRLLKSYPNYPEIFDYPFAPVGDVQAGLSDSAIDINPADGDEIVAMRVFYANSFTVPAQQQARMVVFKNRSVYMVDVDAGAIQQVQTQGHGAYFRRSVADTKNGLMFVDQTGLHKIDRTSQWTFQSQVLGRVWTNDFQPQTTPIDIPVALGAAIHNRYQLTMLEAGASVPTQVIVYDYTREAGGEAGSWTTFDDYPSTCWTEFLGQEYHGDRNGLVYVERDTGEDSDYRDDAGAYTSVALLRLMDFGAMGSRKRLTRVSIQFRRAGGAPVEDIVVTISIDGQTTQLTADQVVLQYLPPTTGLGDKNQSAVYSISFTPPVRKADYFQVGISASALDEPLEICQVAYHVQLLDEHGVEQAAQTTGASK